MRRGGALHAIAAYSPVILRPGWLGRPSVVVGLTGLVWVSLAIRMVAKLPVGLKTTGDSAAYLNQESFRPPLYGWLLDGWHDLTGSLDYFPQVQFLLMALGLLVFAVQFGLLARNAIVAVLLVPLTLLHSSIYDAPRWMMTEAVYLALVLTGLGLQFRHARLGGAASLIGAALCFGLAALSRSTGYAFMLMPILTAVFDARVALRGAVGLAGRSLLVMVLVLLVGMTWNLSRHGRFEIGSWSGLSLLQKSLPLLDASDLPHVPKAVAIVEPYAVAERKLVAAQPDLAAMLRVHMQVSSSDLRWGILIPEAEANWPQWAATDWRGRGELGGKVSKGIIARHPAGYLRLWRNDYLALVLLPAYWPAWASHDIRDRADFAACRLQDNCWALDRYDVALPSRIAMLGISILGAIASLGVLLFGFRRVLRRAASVQLVLFWSLAAVLQAGLLMSSAYEAGHIRMTVAFHVLELATLSWLLIVAIRSRARAQGSIQDLVRTRRSMQRQTAE